MFQSEKEKNYLLISASLDVDAGENVEPAAAATREFAAHTLNLCLGYQPGEENTATFSDVADCKYPVDDQIAVNQNWLSLVDGAFLPGKEITGTEADQMIAAATAALEQ